MDENQGKKKKNKKQLTVNLDNTHYSLITVCVVEMGWKVTSSTTGNTLFWVDCEGCSEIAMTMKPYQFVNHFPSMAEIAHKVELAKNYDKMSRLLPDLYNFHPRSFILPRESKNLKDYMHSIPKKSKRTIIIKPDTGCQGKGIKLIQNPNHVDDIYENAVAQTYISPYLIDGYKFDLRIYVLVTHISPLRIYIHKEGMARFCSEPYKNPKTKNLDEIYGHLTNFSLNKKSENFQTNDTDIAPETGSKRTLTSVYKRLQQDSVNIDELQLKIDNIIRYTIASIAAQLKTAYSSKIFTSDNKCRCFEILGFDILIDSDKKPWLIEVNTMPSLQTGSPFDEALKKSAVMGALKIIDLKTSIKSRYKKALKNCNLKEKVNMCNFDPARETEISQQTNWRLIYPIENNKEIENNMKLAIDFSEKIFVNYTKASMMRVKKIEQQAIERSAPKSAITKKRPDPIKKPLEKDLKSPQKISVYQKSVNARKLTIIPKIGETPKLMNLTNVNTYQQISRPSKLFSSSCFSSPRISRNRIALRSLPDFPSFSIFIPARYFQMEVIKVSEENERMETIFQRSEKTHQLHFKSKIKMIFDSLQKK